MSRMRAALPAKSPTVGLSWQRAIFMNDQAYGEQRRFATRDGEGLQRVSMRLIQHGPRETDGRSYHGRNSPRAGQNQPCPGMSILGYEFDVAGAAAIIR